MRLKLLAPIRYFTSQKGPVQKLTTVLTMWLLPRFYCPNFRTISQHEPDWSPVKVSGQDPVYLPPTHSEKHELLYSPDTVSILVVRHPLIRLVSAWNEKFHKDYKYGYRQDSPNYSLWSDSIGKFKVSLISNPGNSMFRREHNLRFYAKQNATDHWISYGLYRICTLFTAIIANSALKISLI